MTTQNVLTPARAMLSAAPLAWMLLSAAPTAAQELGESAAPAASVTSATTSIDAPAEVFTEAPSSPAPNAVPLQLTQQLTPGSLAGNSSQKRLLDALYAMLDQHPDVLKARATLESAGHDLSTAKGARWPSFKVGTSAGNASMPQTHRRSSYTAVNAEVRMNLLDGGAISAGIRSAEEMEAAQNSMLYSTRQNVLLEALTSLLEFHRFDTKARIAAQSAEIIGQLARVEERRAELGAVGRNDLRRAASRQASARAQQHALQSQRTDAQARFTRYFNYTPTGEWLPDVQVPMQWMPADEQMTLVAAENQSSELREIAHMIERATAEVERSKSQRFPTLAAVVAHTRDPNGVLYAEGTRYGFELNWNFGNGFELRDRILKAINELQAQEAQQETVRREVHETASAAWGRWQAGRQREAQLTDAVREARTAFEGYRRLLEVGRGNLSLVLDAQLDMQRLMLDEADAAYDQRINELRLVRTTGQLLPRELPAQWLDQLFAQSNAAPSRGTSDNSAAPAPRARPDAPSDELPVLTAHPLQLRLVTRLDPRLWAQPENTNLAAAVRW